MVMQHGSSSFVETTGDMRITRHPELTVVSPTVVEPPAQPSAPSNWERRYAAYLRITDAVVVCAAVLLAQYVRFGSTPAAENLVTHNETAYSAVLIGIWLAVGLTAGAWYFWPVWPILGMGIGAVSHALGVRGCVPLR